MNVADSASLMIMLLLFTDAYRMLGLKGDTFDKVVKSKAFLR